MNKFGTQRAFSFHVHLLDKYWTSIEILLEPCSFLVRSFQSTHVYYKNLNYIEGLFPKIFLSFFRCRTDLVQRENADFFKLHVFLRVIGIFPISLMTNDRYNSCNEGICSYIHGEEENWRSSKLIKGFSMR